jgi:hypothetical protein
LRKPLKLRKFTGTHFLGLRAVRHGYYTSIEKDKVPPQKVQKVLYDSQERDNWHPGAGDPPATDGGPPEDSLHRDTSHIFRKP